MLTLIRMLTVTGAVLLAPAVLACGFEDPAAMQTGILNWVYPKSLYVDTAVWRAQLAGTVGTDPQLQTTNKLLVNPGFRKAIKTLRDFGDRFSGKPENQSFVILLMEAMLWSRISLEGGQAILSPHINAPTDAEAVIITQRVVLEAIVDGKISPGEAIDLGLLRLYGKDDAIARTLVLLQRTPYTGAPGVASQ